MALITSYGWDNAAVLLGIAIVLVLAGFMLGGIGGGIVGGVGVVVGGLTLWFFRDPERRVPEAARQPGALVAPADGRIVQIQRVVEPEFLGGEAVQVSIFLSLFDVHVNRVPMSGVVRLYRYIPGRFLAAYRPEASWQNEQTVIGIEGVRGRIVVKQITGVLARRIVCTLREGQRVEAGERFGMMKFGSRMEVLVPVEKARLCVREGMRVRAGETLLGYVEEAVQATETVQEGRCAEE
jgi:phosphatidylserine decarboxylase